MNEEHSIVLYIGDSMSFTARPKYLETSGSWVTVRWYYVEEPSEKDWIGVFTPPVDGDYPIDPSEHSPIKWKVTTTKCCGIDIIMCILALKNAKHI